MTPRRSGSENEHRYEDSQGAWLFRTNSFLCPGLRVFLPAVRPCEPIRKIAAEDFLTLAAHLISRRSVNSRNCNTIQPEINAQLRPVMNHVIQHPFTQDVFFRTVDD